MVSAKIGLRCCEWGWLLRGIRREHLAVDKDSRDGWPRHCSHGPVALFRRLENLKVLVLWTDETPGRDNMRVMASSTVLAVSSPGQCLLHRHCGDALLADNICVRFESSSGLFSAVFLCSFTATLQTCMEEVMRLGYSVR